MSDVVNSGLQALIEAGADAQTNMYDVQLEFANWNATVRASGFEIPDVEAPTYENAYHGVKYSRVKTEQNFERAFSLEFRMDAKYGLYQAFTSLLSWHVDPNTGGVSNANIDKVGKVTVKTIDSAIVAANNAAAGKLAGAPAGLEEYSNPDAGPGEGLIKSGLKWVFENCIVTKVTMPKYSTDSADILKFTVDFKFGNCQYPGFVAGNPGDGNTNL
jgi:hypothetical protein